MREPSWPPLLMKSVIAIAFWAAVIVVARLLWRFSSRPQSTATGGVLRAVDVGTRQLARAVAAVLTALLTLVALFGIALVITGV